MRLLITAWLLMSTVTGFSQTCQLNDFIDLKSSALDDHFKILANKVTPNVSGKAITDFSYAIKDSGKAILQVAFKEPWPPEDVLEVRVYDQNGLIKKSQVYAAVVNIELEVKPGQLIRVEVALKTSRRTDDNLCMYHLFAVRPYDS